MLKLKNYMEDIVFSYMDTVLHDIEMCKCEKCIMDIAAIALNDLPPKYVVTDQGELFSKANAFETQFEIDVISALTKAASIVKFNTQHLK